MEPARAAFWLLLFGGMAARYWWRRRRLSTVLLALIPVADALLLAFTAVDLARGAEAAWSHGLAALYLGFCVVLGPQIVASMDRRFAKRPRVPVNEWRLWLRVVAASALSRRSSSAASACSPTTPSRSTAGSARSR